MHLHCNMIKTAIKYLKRFRAMQRINLSLARGAATSSLRNIDPLNPDTWDFCAFSQNCEDGIIDYLASRINNPNRYFVEIGSSDGIENNTAWLAIAKKYSGIMIEGDKKQSLFSKELMESLNLSVECINMFFTKDNIAELTKILLYNNPDVLSLDIDGNDYYIAKAIIEIGLRPKIFVVEYNSVYGPDNSSTIIYREDFNVVKAHKTQLYYGISITGWKNFFKYHDYKFITVDKNGVNAFFVDKKVFDADFLEKLKGLEFQENYYQMTKFKVPWMKQFELIREMTFFEIKADSKD